MHTTIYIVLIKCTNTIRIILLSRYFDDIPIIINIFTLLLQDESFKEFIQNPIRGKELNNPSIRLCS